MRLCPVVDVLDAQAHLEQVTVHPGYSRRGIGRVIIDRVAEWAGGQGYTTMTLLTFRDVAWNDRTTGGSGSWTFLTAT